MKFDIFITKKPRWNGKKLKLKVSLFHPLNLIEINYYILVENDIKEKKVKSDF